MADEKPVPETLESIGQKLSALINRSMDEVKAHLGVKIEAVDAKVQTLYDVVIAQHELNQRNTAAHSTVHERLDDHELRILALESKRKP